MECVRCIEHSLLLFSELRQLVGLYDPRVDMMMVEEYAHYGVWLECNICSRKIRSAEEVDEQLFPPCKSIGSTSWPRCRVHSRCALERLAACVLHASVGPIVKTFTEKQRRSCHLLLLLLEAGFPHDLAWPIAALTYWII
jgi:hypothetical protein